MCAPRKLTYQTLSRPIRTGTFCANGVVATCWSTAWKPARKSRKPSGPIAIASDVPITESTEYRPPTQSQNPNALAGSMPNTATLSSAVDTATKCCATAAVRASSESSRTPAALSSVHSHSRARRAFVSVSSVPNVFEATMNSVVVGSRPLTFSARSVGSMLETKRTSRPS